ncbi:hypothetical protein ACI2IY_22195 [Lysobacter enzymogenes]|uniref:hypothetical protein n=1 Tax=Lysobacter enzymogenes TaxID=69 RepID=UPI0038511A97
MPIDIYRGDSRTPVQIRADQGFRPRVATDAATGRGIITRCLVPRTPAPHLPPPANETTLQALLLTDTVKLIDVLRDIKTEKNQRTVHVSTDTSPLCGGYSSGYVYRMRFTLNVQANGTGAITAVNDPLQLQSRVSGNVFFDGATLATSNLFGICGGSVDPGVELAFLAMIPMAYITHYCEPGIADPGTPARPWLPF